jgi:hypothetical protein
MIDLDFISTLGHIRSYYMDKWKEKNEHGNTMGTIQKINNAIYIGTLGDLWQNDFYGNKKNMI